MGLTTLIPIAYLASAVLFILGIKRLSHPDTAASGNRLAAIGMLLAVIATLLYLAAQVGHARRQLVQQDLSTALQTVYDTWEPIYLEDNVNVLRRGMEGARDLDPDEALKFDFLMIRIVGTVLTLERVDARARRAIVGSLVEVFSGNPGATAWLERGRQNPHIAPVLAIYDQLASEFDSSGGASPR